MTNTRKRGFAAFLAMAIVSVFGLSIMSPNAISMQAGGVCPGDIDGSGDVNVTDLLTVLGDWGCTGVPCTGDVTGDDNVNVSDLLAVLATWGICELVGCILDGDCDDLDPCTLDFCLGDGTCEYIPIPNCGGGGG